MYQGKNTFLQSGNTTIGSGSATCMIRFYIFDQSLGRQWSSCDRLVLLPWPAKLCRGSSLGGRPSSLVVKLWHSITKRKHNGILWIV